MASSQDHYIGIDVGTGSARACIINAQGDIVGLASEPISLWQPKHGFYEQSTNNIWQSICKAVQQALKKQNTPPSTIRGIGFDATCSLAVFNHETNQPVSVTEPNFNTDQNVILWLDHRPSKETEKINATHHPLLHYVGGNMSVEMEVPKVLWLKNHMPAELFQKCSFFDLADALTHIATGGVGIRERGFNSAAGGGTQAVDEQQGYVPVGVDGSIKGWREDFMKEIGLEDLTTDKFVRMGGVNENGHYLSAGDLAGYLCEKAASELGLPAGIAIGSGVIDAYAGWIGTVGAKVDLDAKSKYQLLDHPVPSNDRSQAFSRLAAVAGTSTCHLALCAEPVFVPGVWGPYRDTIIPDYWMVEGGQSATGELLKHIVETHPAYNTAKALAESSDSDGGGGGIYGFLNRHLEEMARRQNARCLAYLGRHFFFYGDLWGNRSPIADSTMTGSICGITSDVSVDGLALYYYGTMEFIALQTRQIVETMNKAGLGLRSIFMSGSQCQNEILMRLIASVCGMPVVIPRYVDAAVCHGAAMLGAKAASGGTGSAGTGVSEGQTEGLWEIMDRMSKPGTKIEPTEDVCEKALLGAKYEVFLEQCFKQREYRRMVDDAWVKSHGYL